jgi:hypothetical protein
MLSRILDEVLGSRSKIAALRALFSQADLSGREVARRAGLSPRAASLALSELVGLGVVGRRELGGTHQFAINRDRHMVHAALQNLFAAEAGLPEAIGRRLLELAGEGQCVSIALFGSYARGTAAAGSDLDVLFLLKDPRQVPRIKQRLGEGGEAFHRSFGLQLSPYVLASGEFAARLHKGDKLIQGMVREARVIAGKPLAEAVVDES